MSTPNSAIESSASSSPRRDWPRYAIGALLLLALALLGTLGWIYLIVHSSLPQLDGELRIRGLSASVSVSRDTHGVPNIEAANLDDLFFAQGFVTAQDRLWQMDGMRRFAGGELAEILGEDLVKHDRRQRILGLREAAKNTVQQFSPNVRSHFEAYARGVNAYIRTHGDKLPIEFRILRYTPQPWTSVDSALIAAQMVADLSTPPDQALVREKILAKLGPELTADLFVNVSQHDRPPTAMPVSADPTIHQNTNEDNNDEDDGPDDDTSVAGPSFPQLPIETAIENPRFVTGSNNWVVSGAHTTTGKPLLSNDMHLGHQMPNLWYEAHLRCAGFDVAGVTLPGMPYVVVGHNQRIVWGFTNIGPTVEDAYVETFNDDGEYLTPQGWKAAQHRQEVIKVKAKPDVQLDVVITRHGPIVNELYPEETRKITLRWTLYDGIRNPFFEVNSAQNWTEFRHAFSQLDAPAQNVVFADVDGNIGYQATGKIPIRASGDGSLPEDGSTDKFEWTGYIPFEKLPSTFDPPSGIIATANSRIAPDKYPYSISAEWEAPWRAARIYRVLESGKKFSSADMLALQNDVDSEFDRFIADRIVFAVDSVGKASQRAKDAVEILRNWDGRMTANSAAPIIAVATRGEIMRLLLEPKLGDPDKANSQALSWKSYDWMMKTVWLENTLNKLPKRWLPASYASYDELIAAALESAVASQPKMISWQWGAVNAAVIEHPVLREIPILKWWEGPGLNPQSGSPYTVKAVSRTHGPSERMTVDLSDLDKTTLNIVTGQAGNPLSTYYMDQWHAWYEGYTFPLAFSSAAVQQARTHKLTLTPAN